MVLLHKRRMRGSLGESAGDKPSGRSFSCSSRQHRHRHWHWQGKNTPNLLHLTLLSREKGRDELDAYWYTESLSVVTVDFVKSFCQRGVDHQLVTCPVLRRRLSLSSLFFAFHHIRQHLGTQRHDTTPLFPSRHHHPSSAGG